MITLVTAERRRIPPEEIQELKNKVDLRVVAAAFTELCGQCEQYGPCPRCGGRDRFHVQARMFFCRQCCPPEAGAGQHDAYDFARFVGAAQTFSEACAVVTGWAKTIPAHIPHHSERKPQFQSEPKEWRTRAEQALAHSNRLLASAQGEVGRSYLAQRQIEPRTWQAAHLGLASIQDRDGKYGWAIALPWFADGSLTAIQYRFIEPETHRYTRFGFQGYFGDALLYMLPAKDTGTIIMVEGELNALSVWQATPYAALSFGGENLSGRTVAALQRESAGYEKIITWADKEPVARDLHQMVGRPGWAMAPPQDANELLQAGLLPEILRERVMDEHTT